MSVSETQRRGHDAWTSGRRGEARSLLKEALRENGSVELLNDLAVILLSTGEIAAAQQLLQAARFVDPTDEGVIANMADLRALESRRRRLRVAATVPGQVDETALTSPRFSIVIPTRDRRNWLPRAIDSILRQTYGNWQLIVLDNGTDRVEDLMPDDPRVVYRWEPATGLTDALNRGFVHATGELALSLADDDRLVPEALARYHEVIGTAEMVVGTTHIVDLNDVVQWVRGGTQECVEATRAGDMLLGAAICYRLDLFRRLGGFSGDPAIETAADFDLYVRLLEATDPVVIPDVLHLYTDHPGVLSRTRTEEQAQAAALVAASCALPAA